MDTKELLSRGVSEVYIKKEVEALLGKKGSLRIYYGVDPSGPKIHLGHAVHLRKLSILQKLGHKIIFLIGDFTGMIGDPTDRGAVRQPLTRKEVLENAKTYKKQVSRFLSFSGKNPAEIRFNSEWNDKLNFKDLIELSSHFTVQQLLERDMFQKRIKDEKPISLHEFLYPVVQGYDAVMLDADIQMGGTDQTFNMLQGRTLMKSLKNKTQSVISLKLLEGSDGRKMSKSFNNVINIEDDPNDIYGKAMSIKDELIFQYFELATEIPMKKIGDMEKAIKKGENPRNVKALLAFELVKMYYDEKSAKKAEEEFNKVFRDKQNPEDIKEIKLKNHMTIQEAIFASQYISSKSEIRRLFSQNAIKVNEKTENNQDLLVVKNDIIKVGKRRWLKIV
ncbi:tyrosine--tRNA ligase [bacterium]|nr:tyrosine--tRNA ligase [bacterium]